MNAIEMFRTNYVLINNLDDFEAWCKRNGLAIITEEREGVRRYGFMSSGETDLGVVRTVPMYRSQKSGHVISEEEWDDLDLLAKMVDGKDLIDADEFEEVELVVDISREFSMFLAEGEIGITMNIGYEGMRMLWGGAFAVNHLGEEIGVSLDQIYTMVRERFGVEKINPVHY